MSKWQVQEAKAELSAVIQAAQVSPQTITRHGQPVAVVLSYAQYQLFRRQEGRQTLLSFLQSWPQFDIPERDQSDYGRDVNF